MSAFIENLPMSVMPTIMMMAVILAMRRREFQLNSLGLHAGHGAAVLAASEQTDIHRLLHGRLELLDRLVAVVPHQDVDGNLLVVIVELLVQVYLQLQLARAQHEVLPHDGAGLAALTTRRELDAADVQLHRRPADNTVELKWS